jgi:hypothetical protein
MDWPSCSLDIMPLDFLFWGYVKNRIYATEVRDLRDLRTWIMEAVSCSGPGQELIYRLDIPCRTNSAHVEVY